MTMGRMWMNIILHRRWLQGWSSLAMVHHSALSTVTRDSSCSWTCSQEVWDGTELTLRLALVVCMKLLCSGIVRSRALAKRGKLNCWPEAEAPPVPCEVAVLAWAVLPSSGWTQLPASPSSHLPKMKRVLSHGTRSQGLIQLLTSNSVGDVLV